MRKGRREGVRDRENRGETEMEKERDSEKKGRGGGGGEKGMGKMEERECKQHAAVHTEVVVTDAVLLKASYGQRVIGDLLVFVHAWFHNL